MPHTGLERRRPRSKMVIAVKVMPLASVKTGELVHTLDVSLGGAKIGGVKDRLKRGDLVTVQRNRQKANCKVIWAREISEKEMQIGIELLDTDGKIWGLDLSQQQKEEAQKSEANFLAMLTKTST